MSEIFNEEYYTQEVRKKFTRYRNWKKSIKYSNDLKRYLWIKVDKEKPEWDDDIDIGEIGNDNDNFIMDADYLPGGEKYDAKNTKKSNLP